MSNTSIFKRIFAVLAATIFLSLPSEGFSADHLFTLWPLVDYRTSEEAGISSLNLLGPLIDFETQGGQKKFSLRPLYSRRWLDPGDYAYSEFLYPLASKESSEDHSFFQGLRLLSYDFGGTEEKEKGSFQLFPFIFSGEDKDKGEYFAVFPIGGKMYNRLGREEIRFTLFPLYSKTLKKGTTVTNVLWPFFAGISGENESGFKAWPLFGFSEKDGVYRKRMFLWPVFFDYRLALNTDNPMHRKAAFPFYIREDSPQYSSRIVLWPFFRHVENRKKDYEEWEFPWPIFRIARGSGKNATTFLPFFADERSKDSRKRWFLWPIYKIEETESDIYYRRRSRVLFFLYSNLEETLYIEGAFPKKRVALWPLFTYENLEGVSHFYTLSLLEPFFPEKEGIRRNWAPLWWVYQKQWDAQDHVVESLLWNLYWRESQGSDTAWELFPLVSYKRTDTSGRDVKLVKGLLRYRNGPEGKVLNLFYLPWGIHWGAPSSETHEDLP